MTGVRGFEGEPRLEPYHAFFGRLAPMDARYSEDIIDGVVEIVAVEGPVVPSRVRTAYAQSASERRASSRNAKLLDHALVLACRRARILEVKAPVDTGLPSAYATTSRPPKPRVLGPRALEEVPVYELIDVVRLVQQATPRSNAGSLAEGVLFALGVPRVPRPLPANVEAALSVATGSQTDHGASAIDASPGVRTEVQADLLRPTSDGERLAELLVRSTAFDRALESSVRARVAVDLVRDVVALLASTHGLVSAPAVWRAVDVPGPRQAMTMAMLRRLLNRDGYDVLSAEGHDWLRLDVDLLIEQFGLADAPLPPRENRAT